MRDFERCGDKIEFFEIGEIQGTFQCSCVAGHQGEHRTDGVSDGKEYTITWREKE